jgi:histidinol-phosphatase (PHP family)
MINLREIIGDNRLYTLHSHTEFCDGKAQMEAFAREAVARGFAVYGFSPHSPIPIESTCNMTRYHVDDYFREFDRIRSTYGDKVKFLKSMEIDYLGPHWGPAVPYFTDMELDYRIGSVHFIPSQQGDYVDIDGRYENFRKKMDQHFHNDIRYVVETFYAQSCRMVEEGGFDIIGHLDKIGHNAAHFSSGIESEDWYRALVGDLIDRVIAKGLIVEINTKALADHNRFFPSIDHWQRLVDAKVELVVNSDAHVPALINAGRDQAFAILDSLKKSRPVNNE